MKRETIIQSVRNLQTNDFGTLRDLLVEIIALIPEPGAKPN